MKNIYLIGMPGCGKSTIGKIISGEINVDFVDLDNYIEKMTSKTIPELFEIGEKHFREAESDALLKVSRMQNTIVATGGGIIVNEKNTEIMKNTGKVIYINTSPEKILKNSSLDGRPLLKDKNKIFDLYERRGKLYNSSADYIVENETGIDECVQKIIDIIKTEK